MAAREPGKLNQSIRVKIYMIYGKKKLTPRECEERSA